MDVLTSARHAITAHHMLAAGDRVIVAVSGGPDSLCLLHVLRRLADDLSLSLHVAHLNHGLRGADSDADAAYVTALAQEWGIEVTCERADVQAYRALHKLSLEDAARQVRYAFLQRVARTRGASVIAAGHTADDQVETIIMHWLRGAGLAGLRGMLPVQALAGGVRLIRPLLAVSRRDIVAYCAEHALQPRLDRSNEDQRLWRNRLRRSILPELERHSPSLRATTLRSACILADDDAYIEAQVTALWPELAQVAADAVSIDRARWRSLAPAIQRRLIRRAWACLPGGGGDLGWVHVERIRELALRAARREPARLHLPRGVHALVPASTIVLSLTDEAAEATDAPRLVGDALALSAPSRLRLPGSEWVIETELSDASAATDPASGDRFVQRFDADVVGDALTVRRWRAGDRMQPLGMIGRRKLHDIMIDNHVPQSTRAQMPVLLAGEHVLWLVGVRRSDWGKITPATRRVLTVRLIHDDAAAQPALPGKGIDSDALA